MPQVGAALVTGLTAAFGGGAFAAALASTVVALGTIALNLAIASLLGKILAPKGTDSRDVRGLQQVIKNSIAPRRIIYGETICGGVLTSIETTTVNNEELNQIITLCGHPIEDILGVFLDDEYIDISGLADTPFSTNNAANDLTTSWLVDSGAFGPDSEGVRHIAIVKNTGWGYADFTYVTDENLPEVLGDQARNLEIESKGEATRNFWNAPTSVVRDSQTGLYAATGGQQKLTNCAFIYLRFSYNEEIFNKFPQPRFHVKGKRLYNPNLDSALTAYGAAGGSHDLNDPDTWEWSEDWTLCVLDYLINPDYGLAVKASTAGAEIDNVLYNEIDWEQAILSYQNSSEIIGTNIEGDSRNSPRYTVNGIFETDSTPISIMEALLTSGAGSLVYSQGKYKILSGRYRTPESEANIINEDMIVSSVQIQTHTPRAQLFNKAGGTFINRGDGYDPDSPVDMDTNLPEFIADEFPIVDPIDSSGFNPYEIIDGEPIHREFDFPFTVRHWEAQRLAKIQLERIRRGITVSFKATLEAVKYSVGDVVYLEIHSDSKYTGRAFFNRLGLDSAVQNQDSPLTDPYYKQFLITEMNYNSDHTIDIIMVEEAQEIYEWNDGFATPDTSELGTELTSIRSFSPLLAPTFILPSPYETITESTVVFGNKTLVYFTTPEKSSPNWDYQDRYKVSTYVLEYGIVDNPSNPSTRDRVSTWVSAGAFLVTDKSLDVQGPIDIPNIYIDENSVYDFRVRTITSEGRYSSWIYYYDEFSPSAGGWDPTPETLPTGKTVSLTADRLAFNYDSGGSLQSPTGGVFTATEYNFTSPEFRFLLDGVEDRGWQASAGANTYTYNAPSGVGNMPEVVTVEVRETTGTSVAEASASLTTVSIQPGVDGTPGTPGDNGLNVATVYLYQRTATESPIPGDPSSAVTYDFSTGTLVSPNNVPGNGWTESLPVAGDPYLWVILATASNTASTDSIGTGEWSTAELLSIDGTNGIDGYNNKVITAYIRSASTPGTNPGGITYDFTSNTIVSPGLQNGWTEDIPAGSDPVWAVSASASSQSSTDAIGAGEWSSPVQVFADGTAGSSGVDGRTVSLTSERLAFVYDSIDETLQTPSSALFTATAYNFDSAEEYQFLVNGSLSGGQSWSTDNTFTYTPPTDYVDMPEVITVQASNDAGSTVHAEDSVTVVGIKAGIDAVTHYLTNEAHTVATASDGSGADLSGFSETHVIYDGITDVTTSAAHSVVAPATNDGLTLNVGPSTGIYTFSGTWGTANDIATWTLRAAYGGVNYDKVFTLTKSKAGATGSTGPTGDPGSATVFVNQFIRSASQPATPGATSASYNFDTQTFTPTSGWDDGVPSYDGNPVWVTTAQFYSTDGTGTDSNTTWSAPQKLAEDGTAGAAGSASLFINQYIRSASLPSTPGATSASYNFDTATFTPTSGWDSGVPSYDGNPVWVSTAQFYTSDGTGTDNNTIWSTPQKLAEDGTAGSDGIGVRAGLLLNRKAFADSEGSYMGAMYLHGFTAGVAADVTGTINYNGTSYTVPNTAIFTTYNAQVDAFIALDISGNNFTLDSSLPSPYNGASTNVAAVRSKHVDQSNGIPTLSWFYNDGVDEVEFIPTSNHLIIGLFSNTIVSPYAEIIQAIIVSPMTINSAIIRAGRIQTNTLEALTIKTGILENRLISEGGTGSGARIQIGDPDVPLVIQDEFNDNLFRITYDDLLNEAVVELLRGSIAPGTIGGDIFTESGVDELRGFLGLEAPPAGSSGGNVRANSTSVAVSGVTQVLLDDISPTSFETGGLTITLKFSFSDGDSGFQPIAYGYPSITAPVWNFEWWIDSGTGYEQDSSLNSTLTGSVNIEEDEELTGWYWSWSVSGIVTKTITLSAGLDLSFRVDVERSEGITDAPKLNYATASEPVQNSGLINSFETIGTAADSGYTWNDTTVQADSSTDTLTLVAGSNITLDTDFELDAIRITASASGSQTPWISDIDGGGFGLDNIDRLEIQAPGVATDTATFTHDGTNFNTVFANTGTWNLSGITALQVIDGTDIDIRDAGILRIRDSADTSYVQIAHTGSQLQMNPTGTTVFSLIGGLDFRVYDAGNTDYLDISHDGTDANITLGNTTDLNFIGAAGYEFDNGISMGSTVAASVTDLTRHLAVYANTYGLGVTASSLNIIANGVRGASLTGSGGFRVWDSSNTDYVQLSHNGTYPIFQNAATSGGDFQLYDFQGFTMNALAGSATYNDTYTGWYGICNDTAGAIYFGAHNDYDDTGTSGSSTAYIEISAQGPTYASSGGYRTHLYATTEADVQDSFAILGDNGAFLNFWVSSSPIIGHIEAAEGTDLTLIDSSGYTLDFWTDSNTAGTVHALRFRDRKNATDQGADGQVMGFFNAERVGSGATMDFSWGLINNTSAGDAPEVMRLDSTGKLDLYGDDPGVRVFDSSGVNRISLLHNGTDGYVLTNAGAIYYSSSSAAHYYYTGGTASQIRVYDDTGSDYIRIQDNGANSSIYANNNAIQINSATAKLVQFTGATAVRFQDSDNNSWINIVHDGTDGNIAATNTTDINVTGVTYFKAPSFQSTASEGLNLFNANSMVAYRPDTQSFTYDGDTLAHYGMTTYSDSTFGGLSLALSGYAGIRFFEAGVVRAYIDGTTFNTREVRASDSGFSAYTSILHSGVNGYLSTNSGPLYYEAANGGNYFYTNGTQLDVRFYDSSGADYFKITESGSNAQLTTNNNNIQISAGGGFVRFINGTDLRMSDSSNANTLQFDIDSGGLNLGVVAGTINGFNIDLDVDMLDNLFTRPEILDYGVTHQIVTVTANAATIDLTSGNSVYIDLENATSPYDVDITLSNPPASGTYGEVQIMFEQGTNVASINWPSEVTWINGTVPTLNTNNNAIDVIHLFTVDGGASYHGSYILRSGLPITLGDLGDVDLTGTANNDLLFRSGGSWVDTGGLLTWNGSTLGLFDNEIARPEIKDYSITHSDATITANATTLLYTTAQSWFVDVNDGTGNITITLSGGPPTGTYGEMVVRVQQETSSPYRTLTWTRAGGSAANIFWPSAGTAPTLTAGSDAIDIYHFSTWDGGSNWYGSYIQDMQ